MPISKEMALSRLNLMRNKKNHNTNKKSSTERCEFISFLKDVWDGIRN
jgi:hypothetical protein